MTYRHDPYTSPQQPAPESRPHMVAVQMPQRTPYVSYILLAFTITVFVLQLVSQTLLGQDIPALLGMKIGRLIVAGQWWRLLTPMFLHGSILHLGFNMYALYILGPGLERFYGSWRFLALYILAGYAGNVVSFIMTPSPSLGSSTAIFGLLAAQGAFLYQHREMFGARSSQALRNIVMVAAINFIIGLSPGIDNWGHLGGFIAGGLFAYIGGPKLLVRAVPPVPYLEDISQSSQTLLAAAVVLFVFSMLAWVGAG